MKKRLAGDKQKDGMTKKITILGYRYDKYLKTVVSRERYIRLVKGSNSIAVQYFEYIIKI